MTIYVDALEARGWVMRGRAVPSCHMFTDSLDLGELHGLATGIGLKRAWFQRSRVAPHYDLTSTRRELAVSHGAVEVDRRTAVRIWRERRERLAASARSEVNG